MYGTPCRIRRPQILVWVLVPAIRPAPDPEAPPRNPRVRSFLRKRKAARGGRRTAVEVFFPSVNVCCALSRPTALATPIFRYLRLCLVKSPGARGIRASNLHRLTLSAPGGRLGSPAPGEAASCPRSWDSGEPARPETSLALSLSALASPQADRSAPQASLPVVLQLHQTQRQGLYPQHSPSPCRELVVLECEEHEPEVRERGAEVPERRLRFLLEFIPCLSAFFPSSHTSEIFFVKKVSCAVI
ncbi:hypothetical protein AB1E18_013769 [Capra hircus]